MSEKPKRKFSQFRLPTALVMMLTAGLILWRDIVWHHTALLEDGIGIIGEQLGRGWPCCFEYALTVLPGMSVPQQRNEPYTAIYLSDLITDVIAGLLTVALIGLVSEWLIRRREVGMSEKPKVLWFRLHLLTAVLMMLLGGMMLGMNLRSPRLRIASTDDEMYYCSYDVTVRGFPFSHTQKFRMLKFSVKRLAESDLRQPETLLGESVNTNAESFNYQVCNILACSVVLLSVALVAEFIIRRREAKQP